jgi:vacuolar-type H+-ATPase subunit H
MKIHTGPPEVSLAEEARHEAQKEQQKMVDQKRQRHLKKARSKVQNMVAEIAEVVSTPRDKNRDVDFEVAV